MVLEEEELWLLRIRQRKVGTASRLQRVHLCVSYFHTYTVEPKSLSDSSQRFEMPRQSPVLSKGWRPRHTHVELLCKNDITKSPSRFVSDEVRLVRERNRLARWR